MNERYCYNLMTEEKSGINQRHRRTNPKQKREEIYCYEEDEQPDPYDDDSDLDLRHKPSDDEDDSFTYGVGRIKKAESKKRKLKAKLHLIQRKKMLSGDSPLKSQQIIPDVDYVSYVPAPGKSKPELKMFNPETHIENIALKIQYERQLSDIYAQFGRRIVKIEEKCVTNRWRYLLRQVEEVGRDFASEREERIKLKRKLAKFSQNAWHRLESIHEQRNREEERKMRKQSLDILKHVKWDFWGSAMKVRKVAAEQNRVRLERESKMKKLEDLVVKQFEASQKITQILEGYKEVSLENVQVSHNTRVPVIIDVRRYPKCEYLGLHEDNVIRPSLLIKFPLREYQLLGVYWISTLQKRGMNAILADEMGLGKTIQTIALLGHLAIDKGIWGPHLVIVPTTILMNWEIQFKRWCPAFKIMTYFGSTKERKLKRKGWSRLNSFHVCITTYKIAVTDHPIFRRKKWYYMILDEAHNIKNFKSQRWQTLLNFNAHSRLLLTGTPLQNDLTELWSLLHFLMPKIFNSFDDFNEWFNIPFQEALEKNFPISQQILKKLHTVLRPFFLRRLKKDVETQLPKKTECIIRCAMSRRQKYLYDEMIWHQNRRQRTNESSGMMNVLMGLKKICNHPDLFQPRIEESPLSWVPLTVVIPHHMFLKCHFETYCTPELRDFVEPFTARFEQVAEDILQAYALINITAENEQYYKHKFADRLAFAHVNYERSKRKNFRPFQFDFGAFAVVEEVVPYYLTKSIEERAKEFEVVFDKFLFMVPHVMARPARLATFPMSSEVQAETNRLEYLSRRVKELLPPSIELIRSRFLLHFPDKKIVLYDSGKLVKMVFLLKAIKYRGQKTLIFTQMTRMLDIFEKVLNMFKFNYVRLDGNTKTELRQTIVERFNNDPRVLCFISSTRSGGIGLNLTGASNVIFYDTDWNPAMDKQAQDRCHRIGQTRNVIIYRLITEYSIEENILMKSIQKRKLESLVTEDGMFDTSYFQKVSLKGLLEGAIDYRQDQAGDLAAVEDEEDRAMLQDAQKERKDVKDEEQEELETHMLPPLFRYGLKMLENEQFVTTINDELSEEEEFQEKVILEVAAQEEQLYESEEAMEDVLKKEEGVGKKEEEEEQEKIEENYNISTLQKLKAMSIYQTQYLFMKQHFYQQQETALAEPEEQPEKEQRRRKTKKRRRKAD